MRLPLGFLSQKHNCPLCRTVVKVSTPEARPSEMSLEEILAAPDLHPLAHVEPEDIEGVLYHSKKINSQIDMISLASFGRIFLLKNFKPIYAFIILEWYYLLFVKTF